MPRHEVLSLIIFFLCLFILAYPVSFVLTKILRGDEIFASEKNILRFLGMKGQNDQRASAYVRDLLLFNVCGLSFVFLVLSFQHILPFNPQNLPGLPWHLAFNTAISFMTNTNWQVYSGEASLSYFSQMVALTSQNFLSAATGLSIVGVIYRGLTKKQDGKVGNFSYDVCRLTLYLFLPLSLIFAVVLVGEGVIQNLEPYLDVVGLEGHQFTLPMGPVASQVAIKQLGTNGGGFFGVNSAHPFENPTPFSNFLQTLAILLIPVAQVLSFGQLLGRPKEGRALLWSMLIIFIPALMLALWSEHAGSPILGVIMEGKEVRFSVTDSTLWGVATTAASNGSVNSMHSSFTPLAGLVFIFQMLTGEVVLGGVGAGLYGISLYAIITLFLAGLMVGRSPEWLGKKIEAYEVKLSLIAILVPSALVMVGVALGSQMDWGTSSLSQTGPHGLSELLYAFASTAGNNGSAFGGFNANTPILNVILGLCMLIGRFVVIIPVVYIMGSLSQKKIIPSSSGTFPTDGVLFSVILAGVILIFGALTFFPLLALGPIASHFLMNAQFSF